MATQPDTALQGAPEIDERPAEMHRRVLYALMLPVVRLSFIFGVPMKELGQLLQMAFFHETRRRGLKMEEAADALEVSARKAALLSRQLKTNFLRAEQEHSLPRRIEFMLFAEPLSLARMKQVMTEDDPADIDRALGLLLEQGRIKKLEGRTEQFGLVNTQHRLVASGWLARLDALGNLMASIANTVLARFFRGEPRAFARTVSLRVRQRDLPKLEALYQQRLWPELVALEEAAQGDETAESMDVSLLWAPYEYALNDAPDGDES